MTSARRSGGRKVVYARVTKRKDYRASQPQSALYPSCYYTPNLCIQEKEEDEEEEEGILR